MKSKRVNLRHLIHILPLNAGRVLFRKKTGILIFALFVLISCAQKDRDHSHLTDDIKYWEDVVLQNNLTTDSLISLLNTRVEANDDKSVSILCRAIGQRMRNSSDFFQAIQYHQQGLSAAVRLKDTLEIVQALNHLGTDFRRIGSFPEASNYHYGALQMAELSSKKEDSIMTKYKTMAFNGIGNVFLAIGDLVEAEIFFRKALKEDQTQRNSLGQAINLANIGAIFEQKAMYDSALVYFNNSMLQNILAGSNTGIGLSHINIGQIYEAQGDLKRAEAEYISASTIMDSISDKWHWLEAELAITKINLLRSQFSEVKNRLEKIRKTAEDIHSPQHLSRTYHMLYEYNIKQGNLNEAIKNFKTSIAYQDSIQNVQKLNKITDTKIKYERDQTNRVIEQLNLQNQIEAKEKKIIIFFSAIVIFLLITTLAISYHSYIQKAKRNKLLKELNHIRSTFFTNLTHQFKTPLTVILGHSRQLQQNHTIDETKRQYYSFSIEKQGEKMLNLINQILEMTKVSESLHKPVWKNGNITLFIQQIINRYHLYAIDKNILLEFHPPIKPLEIDFIPNYIDDILQNLLSNAIKFTSENGRVRVFIRKEDNFFVLSVEDNGSGMSEEEIDKIFDIFYQGQKSEDQYCGGIGLPFVKQMVDSIAGKIDVKSKLNEGSTFTIKLPLKARGKTKIEKLVILDESQKYSWNTDKLESEKIQSTPETYKQERKKDNKPTILAIDNNIDMLRYMESLLNDDYHVITANNANDGLDKALQIIPDLIITDIIMSPKDGLTLCKEIRSTTLLNHIPIIIITGKNTNEDLIKGLKCGANAFISKPFKAEELLTRISNMLDLTNFMKDKYMKAIFKTDTNEAVDVNMAFLQKITDLILKNISDDNLSPQMLADKMNISLSQLNRKMNVISGYSTNSYIIHVKIDHAKNLLTKSEKNINEIAEACGFYDSAYFSRTFKKHTGYTPTMYREKIIRT